MAVSRLSISVTPELDRTLRTLARQRGEDVSRLVEILLREHPIVGAAVRSGRGPQVRFRTKKGRSLEELRALGRAARGRWRRAEESGEVSLGPARGTP